MLGPNRKSTHFCHLFISTLRCWSFLSPSSTRTWTGGMDPSNTSSREKAQASCLPSTTPLGISTPFRGSTERKGPSTPWGLKPWTGGQAGRWSRSRSSSSRSKTSMTMSPSSWMDLILPLCQKCHQWVRWSSPILTGSDSSMEGPSV